MRLAELNRISYVHTLPYNKQKLDKHLYDFWLEDADDLDWTIVKNTISECVGLGSSEYGSWLQATNTTKAAREKVKKQVDADADAIKHETDITSWHCHVDNGGYILKRGKNNEAVLVWLNTKEDRHTFWVRNDQINFSNDTFTQVVFHEHMLEEPKEEMRKSLKLCMGMGLLPDDLQNSIRAAASAKFVVGSLKATKEEILHPNNPHELTADMRAEFEKFFAQYHIVQRFPKNAASYESVESVSENILKSTDAGKMFLAELQKGVQDVANESYSDWYANQIVL